MPATTTVKKILKKDGIESTSTKSNWCLEEALCHVISVDTTHLNKVIEENGVPKIYKSIKCRHNDGLTTTPQKNPTNCFESLCRIIAGQQLAGAAAESIWTKLLETTKPQLSPQTVLKLSELGLEKYLQKPSGLSNAKAKSIVDLAQKFDANVLEDSFLTNAPEEDVRRALLGVRGLGPWSCDMFLMFHLEKPDILPLGDLGVRKGIAKHFNLRGSGKHGRLCAKKDYHKIMEVTKPYKPYLSILSYYMWKVADTPYISDSPKKKGLPEKGVRKMKKKRIKI
mmetsp:Transcript_10646/g.16301  ORF Transcript_10646/g.16301 Transcript_10646/m.16301 type:complete len:282 (-) Transcript_10646:1392-2237(-)|eukprot:CAMPEP_0178912740 /NCGR_PEP_ID=MMETSP0786-20121207/10441_1 /TAXON_ID=186022 /ORGANISM="Thalassionema frauenfeldii, Strain CCMP 1798" /LENGTH=281 /DNA_ID=CAMNT_0020585377 /DNA_START=25 /DNA_END=870 /DNA_ORIENTATION=-